MDKIDLERKEQELKVLTDNAIYLHATADGYEPDGDQFGRTRALANLVGYFSYELAKLRGAGTTKFVDRTKFEA